MRRRAIKHRERQNDSRARNDKQQPRRQPAADAVQLPADPDGQLLRLWSGKRWQKFKAWRYCSSLIQPRSSTSSRCISAICPAGPPKLRQPMRADTRTSSAKSGWEEEVVIYVPITFRPHNAGRRRQHLG
jgi:hypothetical protein